MTDELKGLNALAIDTSGKTVTVGAMRDGVVTALTSDDGQTQAGSLATLVSDALTSAELAFSELSFVTTSLGPGSFTGLRVGLAYAKAVALARDIPLIGIDTFSQVASERGATCDLALIRMKADHYYVQRDSEEEIQVMTTAALAELGEATTAPLTIGCIGFAPDSELLQALSDDGENLKTIVLTPRIGALLTLAGRRFASGDVPDWVELEPIYVQASSAELRWRERQ